jgi:feruloyl-CoA synthase
MNTTREAPLRSARFGTTEASVERRSDGSIILRRKEALGPYPDKLTERLEQSALLSPERVFLGEMRPDGSWTRLRYGDALAAIRSIGQALLERGLSADRPIVTLAENSIENALLALGAMYVGVTCVAVSPSYSLLAKDFTKLRHIFRQIDPGLIFASNGQRYQNAIEAVAPNGAEIVVVESPFHRADSHGVGRRVTLFSSLLNTAAQRDADDAHARITPDTIAKLLFTSGSTGMPKGVPMPQRMLCANQQAIVQAFPFLTDEPPVFVDWLPWHHTFGGNNNLGMAIYNGGSYYIDNGKPLPGLIEATVRAIRDVSPTFFMSVPKGVEALLPYLRNDLALRESLFRNMKATLFGGTTMPAHIFNEFESLAIDTVGVRITNVGINGSTEAGPCALMANWHVGDQPLIGVPAPGMEAKIVACGNKFEVRLRGPAVMPAYWRDPERTAAAFDEEGFFRIGDAVAPVDSQRWETGLLFNGRVVEDFKLTSGTWVNVGGLRDRLIARFAPYIRDAVIAGHGHGFVAAIMFPDIESCRKLCPALPTDAGLAEITSHPGVRAHFQRLLDTQDENVGSAELIERLVLEYDLPTLDNGELTDKNAISQRAVLERRANVVEELFRDTPSDRTLERTAGTTA